MSFLVTNFPMPPSANGLYAYVRNRMVKSKAYREYERDVMKWLIINPEQLKGLRAFIKDLGNQVFHVETVFYMPRTSIVCLNGKPKKNDTANRIKALHDVLSSIIMSVDDSYFWSGTFSKVPIELPNAYVDIRFTLRTIE